MRDQLEVIEPDTPTARLLTRQQAAKMNRLRVQQESKRFTFLALRNLAKLAQYAESEAARVAACQALLDRAWGKPSQAVDIESKSQALVAIKFVE